MKRLMWIVTAFVAVECVAAVSMPRVACDVGIGTATTRHPDWTFSANAGAYKARRISVWVK